MTGRHVRLLLASALAAVAIGCAPEQGSAPAVSTTSPKGAIDAAVASLKAGDLKALVESQVPPAHIEKLRTEWTQDMQAEQPSDEEKAEFAQMMADLTASDAETKLMEQLEPQLVQFEKEMAPQMPMMIGMGKGLLISSIQENKDLTEAQKQQAQQSLDAFANWLQTAKFTDRALAKQAIGHVVASARELGIKNLDEARALSFDDAMAKGSIAFRGIKKVLDTYGFSIDAVLDSVKTEVVSEQGDAAKVKVSYQMLGQALAFETDLVRRDGRWYGKQTITELEKPPVAEESVDVDEEASDEAAPEISGEDEVAEEAAEG